MIRNFTSLLFRPVRLTAKHQFAFGDEFAILKREKEVKIAKKLKQTLQPTYLEVTDTTLSGSSCGQMYKVTIQSPVFEGKSRVAQHQMVSECLAQELKTIHAFNLKTKVPKKVQQPLPNKQQQSQTKKAQQPVKQQNSSVKQQ